MAVAKAVWKQSFCQYVGSKEKNGSKKSSAGLKFLAELLPTPSHASESKSVANALALLGDV